MHNFNDKPPASLLNNQGATLFDRSRPMLCAGFRTLRRPV